MLDHALTGEGAWTFWRRSKPCAMDTMAAGWSPLRWCLDVSPAVSFPGGEVELNLSLANEDVLPPGRYPASVAIVGQEGWRWERSVEVAVDAGRGPLAVPVLAEHVTVNGVPGGTAGRVSRHRRGSGGRPRHYRHDQASCSAHATSARRHARFQRGRTGLAGSDGLDIRAQRGGAESFGLLLVGHAGELEGDDWRSVAAAVDRGATAVVLNPWELIAPGETSALPFATPISCTSFRDWLYHKECFATTPIS